MNTRAKFAAATAIATFLLLLVGGLVNPTGSSLACPDWPLCFGQVMPEMTGGVFYEHSHRLVATGVGIMTVILTILLWRTHRKLGLAALVMVCVQGTLGGLTVIFKLPAAISIAHLGLSMIFFCYLLYLTQVTQTAPTRTEVAPGLRRSFVVAAALVYAQIVLGAVVRHTESWLACRDEIPLCGGALWPSDLGWMAQLHMGHRIFGCLVGLHVIGTGIRALKQLRGFPRVLAALAPVLVLLQVSFGVYVVWTWRTTLSVELHLAGAVLLLATTFGLVLTTRAGAPATERVVHAQEAHSLIRELFQLTKPRISVLSVATAAAGMSLAGTFDGTLAWTTLVGTLLLVGAANTLNMYIERDVDAKMARTRRRPLPSGRLAPTIALVFGLVQAAIAIPLLWVGANLLTGALGALALVLYVLVYTPLKRVTTHALLVGAIPGAMPPLLGYTAVSNTIDGACLGVFAAMFLWQVPHFLAIAMFQKDDYRAAGLKILPVEKGEDAARRSIVIYLALQVAVTLLLVPLGLGGVGYFLGALVMGAAMLGWGIWAMRTQQGSRWARQFFLGTITYLPVLFLLLLVA